VGALSIALSYSLIILVLVHFFGDQFATVLSAPSLASVLYLLPLALISTSVAKILNAWLLRKKRFQANSANKAVHKVSEVVAQSTLGYFNISSGLALGDLIGRVLNAVVTIVQSRAYSMKAHGVKISSMRKALIDYIQFPKYSILPSMLNLLASTIPIFYIETRYPIDVSGSFNFSRIVLSVPLAVISAPISQVLVQFVAECRNFAKPVEPQLRSVFFKISAIATGLTVLLAFFGSTIFSFVFGNQWATAGDYSRVLVLSTSIAFVVSTFTMIPILLGKIRATAAWQVAYFALTASLFLLPQIQFRTLLWIIVAIEVLAYLSYGVIIYRIVLNSEKKNLTQVG
jgi:O-antigen/teichoic acid export membrane protein